MYRPSESQGPDLGARSRSDERLDHAAAHDALYIAGQVLIVLAFLNGARDVYRETQPVWALLVGGLAALGVAILSRPGYFTVQPKVARVLILFGSYVGTVRTVGFR